MKYILYLIFIIIAVFLGKHILNKINDKIDNEKIVDVKITNNDTNNIDGLKKQNELKNLKENKYY